MQNYWLQSSHGAINHILFFKTFICTKRTDERYKKKCIILPQIVEQSWFLHLLSGWLVGLCICKCTLNKYNQIYLERGTLKEPENQQRYACNSI